MTNPFEALAERQMPSATKAKHRVAEKREARREEARVRKLSPLEKKQQEQAKLLSLYRDYRRKLRQGIVDQHGADFAGLVRLIRNSHPDREQLIHDHVARSGWLLEADEDTRMATLSYIDAAFASGRTRDGRPPIDDPLWGEPLSPFLKIRKLLAGF